MTTSPEHPVRIDVRTGDRASAILIGEGIADRLAAVLDAQRIGPRRFIVSNPVIWRFHGPQMQRALGGGEPILVPDGERFKNLQSVSRIYEALIRANADRGSVPGVAVRAQCTLQFIVGHAGLRTGAALDHVGELLLDTLDVTLADDPGAPSPAAMLLDASALRGWLPPRRPSSAENSAASSGAITKARYRQPRPTSP